MMHQPIDAEDVERFERMNRNVEPQVIPALLTENQLTKSDNSLVKQSCLDGSLVQDASPDSSVSPQEGLGDVPVGNDGKPGEPSEYVLKVYSPCARCGFIGYKLQGHKLCPRCESEYDIMGEEDCLVRRDNG